MYVWRLDSETWLADKIVEGWSSMIWTERHVEFGDFQMKTPFVGETFKLLPEGCLITLQDSKEIMIVEEKLITTNDDGVKELSIKGRSFESFLENRIITGDYQDPFPMTREYTVQDAVMVMIYNSIFNTTTTDHLGSPYPHNPDEALPNVVISDSTVITAEPPVGPPTPPTPTNWHPEDLQTTQEWWVDNGEVYSQILNMLTTGKLGLRCIRPPFEAGQIIIMELDGTLDRYPSSSYHDQLKFDVYNGRNRTTTPSTVDPLSPVIFRYDAGHIVSPSYLFSVKDYKNYGYVDSSYGSTVVYDGDPDDINGLNMRAMYINAGTISDDVVDYDLALLQKGKAELKKHNRQHLIDGSISISTPHKYGVDYFLGDYVTMIGEYGITQDVQVNEFIRTEDSTGERSYPTLIHKMD